MSKRGGDWGADMYAAGKDPLTPGISPFLVPSTSFRRPC